MKYFGITQQCAAWLLDRKHVQEVVHDLLRDATGLKVLQQADFAESQLRLAGSSDGEVLTMWNVDYLSGTGEEPWGFIRLSEPAGLFLEPAISKEVFERCLYVINQRLQALLIDTAFIHRKQEHGIHTCLAGRGEDARHFSIAFKEWTVGTGHASVRSVICIGPLWSFDQLIRTLTAESDKLMPLSLKADELAASRRKRPVLNGDYFVSLRNAVAPASEHETPTGFEQVQAAIEVPAQADAYRTIHWTYEDWIRPDSPLSKTQRGILESDALDRHPIRIIGPGGSGKTLLMLLITMRLLLRARTQENPIRVLYIVHNQQMTMKVKERFTVLGAQVFLDGKIPQVLEIRTLSSLARGYMQLEDQIVIDVDAEKTKEFQLETIKSALTETIDRKTDSIEKAASDLLLRVRDDLKVRDAFSRLLMAEISVAIKAHELHEDRRRYVESERPLSRFHGALNVKERDFVYAVFESYHRQVFEEYQVLDSDDLAISLLGKLRTPISQLRRKTEGFDYVMIDETQLFNENERRVFSLLTKGTTPHVPIALALDEAQEPYGFTSAGLGVLGIDSIENETLPNSHRSTKPILDLAFHILQQTTDLFCADFPDFTSIGRSMAPNEHRAASFPRIVEASDESANLGRFVARRVGELRRANIRQIAVICHADSYWSVLEDELKRSRDLPLYVLRQRGENLTPDQPVVVLSRPSYVGGQEFDAVILVGLEQGVAPPVLRESPALAAALEQQVLREMYLSVTRARFQVIVALSANAYPNGILCTAAGAGLIRWDRKATREQLSLPSM